jgi:hypothetical protein
MSIVPLPPVGRRPDNGTPPSFINYWSRGGSENPQPYRHPGSRHWGNVIGTHVPQRFHNHMRSSPLRVCACHSGT